MPHKYLYQQMTQDYRHSLTHATQGGTFEDAARAHRNRWLTNEEVMARVNDAIQREKASKSIEQDRSDETIEQDWNVFLKSKLVNPTHNKFI